jgi:hypothetical protein
MFRIFDYSPHTTYQLLWFGQITSLEPPYHPDKIRPFWPPEQYPQNTSVDFNIKAIVSTVLQ